MSCSRKQRSDVGEARTLLCVYEKRKTSDISKPSRIFYNKAYGTVSCAVPESFVRGGPTQTRRFFLVNESREDPNTI